MVASVMAASAHAAVPRLAESFGIHPREHHEYIIEDPVLIVSHNFTYYAPEGIMAVPLSEPTTVTFGRKPCSDVRTRSKHVHLVLPDEVQDRMASMTDRMAGKHVDVADLHGAIIFDGNTLFYRHLGDQPTVLAQRILASRIITQADAVLPIGRGQTIGFGASTDAFGGPLWWYYFRITSLRHLKQLAARRRM